MSKLLSRIGVVSSFTMISRVLGLGRDVLTSAIFGASVWNSAFITAFTLPNLFRRLLGEGALTAALMPSLSDEKERGGIDAVYTLLNKALSWLLVVCIGLIILVAGVYWSLQLFAIGEKWMLVADLAVLLFPYVLLVCVAAIISAALNLEGVFGIPALTAVWLNSSILLCLGVGGWLIGDSMFSRITWLCAGVLIGGTLQLLIPAIVLARRGWVPSLDLRLSDGMRRVMVMTAPGVVGAAVYQINIVISRSFAYTVSEEGATLMYLANRLVELPIGVFAIAISTVVFPAFAMAASRNRMDEFASTYRNGVLIASMMAFPSAIGLVVLGEDIVRILFEHGQFTAKDTANLMPVLYIFSVGMPLISLISIETRALYSIKAVKAPVRVAAIILPVNVGLSFLLMEFWGIIGLAVATNTSILLQTILLHRALKKRESCIELGTLFSPIARCFVGALVMGGVLYFGRELMEGRGFVLSLESFLSLVVLIPVGVGVYFSVLLLLGVAPAREAFAMIKGRLGKGGE